MLCWLFGHKWVTRSFKTTGGDTVFVNKCRRCGNTTTQIVPRSWRDDVSEAIEAGLKIQLT